ncbi:MAG TPA: DUF4097 family beta strand repeat-containing protein [Kofleriaceae bacterium]|nr:DUF4097 family beta strand repeat-containing protein [Kofleriaceae bacterium]
MSSSRTSGPSVLVLVVGLGALLPAAAACGQVTGSFHRTLPVSGPVNLEVVTGSGDITARTGPPGSVSVTARIQASRGMVGGDPEEVVHAIEQKPPIRQDGSSIHLERPAHDNVSIDYEIVVPPDTRLRAHTGSGDQRVHGLRRGIELEAGSGDIEVEGVAGGLRAETGSGNVRGTQVAAPVDVHTGSGEIHLGLVGPGFVRTNTGSGDVEIRGVVGGLAVETGSGEVVAEGVARAAWSLETSSGDVRLQLGAGTSYNLDVATGSGDITTARPVQMTVQGRVKDGGRDQLSGRVGSGGPMVKVRTGSGDVDIH